MDDVAATEIEAKVGASRHPTDHLVRLRSDEERWYLLHSAECRGAREGSLQGCPYAQAMDDTDVSGWPEDETLRVRVEMDTEGSWCEFERVER